MNSLLKSGRATFAALHTTMTLKGVALKTALLEVVRE